MAPKSRNLTGLIFGRLRCLYKLEERGVSGHIQWLCQCDCGNTSTVLACNLMKMNTTSCGCLGVESRKTHGKSSTKLYMVWSSMKSRCANEGDQSYHNYGGRGITVAQSWYNFESFFSWAMSTGYRVGLTLERNNNDMGYSPSNCSWVPKSCQSSNTRRTIWVDVKGKRMPLKKACEHLGVNYHLVQNRITNLGWDLQRALYVKSKDENDRNVVVIRIGGKNLSIAGWARELGLSYKTLYSRLTIKAKKEGISHHDSACLSSVIAALTGVPVLIAKEQ